MNKRLFAGREYDYQYKPTDFYLDERILAQPLHWRKPRTIFVASMCDLFHENVPFGLIHLVIDRAAACPNCTFMLLTKRPERMKMFFDQLTTVDSKTWPLPIPNVWLGVTAENQERADERIPILLSIAAAKRFVSLEPLLAPITLFDTSDGILEGPAVIKHGGTTVGSPHEPPEGYDDSYPGIDWTIVGGESGPGARPMHPDWVRSLRDQCVAAGVPFHFKAWGEWVTHPYRDWKTHEKQGDMFRHGRYAKVLGEHRLLDGNLWDQKPDLLVMEKP